MARTVLVVLTLEIPDDMGQRHVREVLHDLVVDKAGGYIGEPDDLAGVTLVRITTAEE